MQNLTFKHILFLRQKIYCLSTNSSVSEVAYILGFDYPQHFSKLFKLKTGYSQENLENPLKKHFSDGLLQIKTTPP